MVKKVMETSAFIAEAVKHSKVKVIPMYPITPQTHIVERISELVNNGELDAELIHVESEHSAMSAAVGASATGVRTFTATSSQGLALMSEILFVASGMRLPIVLVNANRALSAPINIWNDHQDSMFVRDSGWIQIYAESAQEAYDSVIQAFKVSENKNIRVPAMVCIDGFTLSHVFEPAEILEQEKVDEFLPSFDPGNLKLDPNHPITMGPVGLPNSYMETRKDLHDALLRSIDEIKEINNQFYEKFGRKYGDGLIETYKIDDADYAIIALGTIATTVRGIVDELREQGKKVGLIRIRAYRPFPKESLLKATKNLKGVAVLDRNISLGSYGAVAMDVKNVLFDKNIKVDTYIVGLGGRDVNQNHIKQVFENLYKETEFNQWLF